MGTGDREIARVRRDAEDLIARLAAYREDARRAREAMTVLERGAEEIERDVRRLLADIDAL